MTELDAIVRNSFISFVSDVRLESWTGRREREAISLYAFGHLLKQVRQGSVLYDPAQIGIEIPVPQIPEYGRVCRKSERRRKTQVCKDLVIWPQPAMTCWDLNDNPTVAPVAILEWKFGVRSISERDLTWLKSFSRIYTNFIGFAVSANRPGEHLLLKVARVSGGKAILDWFCV